MKCIKMFKVCRFFSFSHYKDYDIQGKNLSEANRIEKNGLYPSHPENDFKKPNKNEKFARSAFNSYRYLREDRN